MKFVAFIFFFLFVLSLLVGGYQYVLYTVKRQESDEQPVPKKHKKYFASTALCLGLCIIVFLMRDAFVGNQQENATQKANAAVPTPPATEVQESSPVEVSPDPEKAKWDHEKNDDRYDDSKDRQGNKDRQDEDRSKGSDTPKQDQPGHPGIDPIWEKPDDDDDDEDDDDDDDPNRPISKGVGTN